MKLVTVADGRPSDAAAGIAMPWPSQQRTGGAASAFGRTESRRSGVTASMRPPRLASSSSTCPGVCSGMAADQRAITQLGRKGQLAPSDHAGSGPRRRGPGRSGDRTGRRADRPDAGPRPRGDRPALRPRGRGPRPSASASCRRPSVNVASCKASEPASASRRRAVAPGSPESAIEADRDMLPRPARGDKDLPGFGQRTGHRLLDQDVPAGGEAALGEVGMGGGRRGDQGGIRCAASHCLLELAANQGAWKAGSDFPASLPARLHDAAHPDLRQRRQRGQMVSFDHLAAADQGKSHVAIALRARPQVPSHAVASEPALQQARTMGIDRIRPGVATLARDSCRAPTAAHLRLIRWLRPPRHASCIADLTIG